MEQLETQFVDKHYIWQMSVSLGCRGDSGLWIKYTVLALFSYHCGSVTAGLAPRVSLLGSSSVLCRIVRPREGIGCCSLQGPCPLQAWPWAPQLVVLFWKDVEPVGK